MFIVSVGKRKHYYRTEPARVGGLALISLILKQWRSSYGLVMRNEKYRTFVKVLYSLNTNVIKIAIYWKVCYLVNQPMMQHRLLPSTTTHCTCFMHFIYSLQTICIWGPKSWGGGIYKSFPSFLFYFASQTFLKFEKLDMLAWVTWVKNTKAMTQRLHYWE